jgi:hypothetical protein
MRIELIDPVWMRLSGIAAEALRMSEGEAERFRGNRVAKLVGLLPFIAGCEDLSAARSPTWRPSSSRTAPRREGPSTTLRRTTPRPFIGFGRSPISPAATAR